MYIHLLYLPSSYSILVHLIEKKIFDTCDAFRIEYVTAKKMLNDKVNCQRPPPPPHLTPVSNFNYRVTKSENPDYPVGTYVQIMVGWRTHTILSDPTKLNKVMEMGDLSKSLALGPLGMPG